MVENKGQNMTTSVVECLICKIVSKHDKLQARDKIKTEILVSCITIFAQDKSCLKYLSGKTQVPRQIDKTLDKSL